jgi:hypothetical protein
MKTEDVKISDLVAEGTTQARHYDEELVERYAEAMKDGAVFPPLVAFKDGNVLYLADGFHRRGAALKVGKKSIDVDVRKPLDGESGQRSAILFAVGANDDHGHNRTQTDKRHAVEMLLRDPEWSKWTDREIARQCRVSHPFVATQRTKLINSGVLTQEDKRTAKRDGKEYEVDTSKIGKSKDHKPARAPAKSKQKTKKDEDGWTREDDLDAAALLGAWEKFAKIWKEKTRAAQLHVASTLRRSSAELFQ